MGYNSNLLHTVKSLLHVSKKHVNIGLSMESNDDLDPVSLFGSGMSFEYDYLMTQISTLVPISLFVYWMIFEYG